MLLCETFCQWLVIRDGVVMAIDSVNLGQVTGSKVARTIQLQNKVEFLK